MEKYFTNIEKVLKLENIKLSDHLLHTKIYLEYDEEEAFIFLTQNQVLFTNVIEQHTEKIMYVITFDKVEQFNKAILLYTIRSKRRSKLYAFSFL
jgi:hypothetical protein